MSLQMSAFLFAYLIFIAIFLFYTFFNLYHVLKFGFVSFWAYAITFTYIGLSILALFVSYFYISQIDWSIVVYFFPLTSEF